MNKRLYISVHVYDDGDTELKKVALTDTEKKIQTDLVFDIEKDTIKLVTELKSYGHEKSDIIKSIHYALKNSEPCIIGKV
jgi:hypothetical protein